jgi:hypothetical protein
MWDAGHRLYNGMKRRLLNFVTALSLLLFLAAVAMWACGYAMPSTLRLAWARAEDRSIHGYRASTVAGQLCLIHLRVTLDDDATFRRVAHDWGVPNHAELRMDSWPPSPWPTNRLGFGGYLYQRLGQHGDVGSRSKWAVPWWLPAGAASVLPACRCIATLRRRRLRRRGLCERCRYDLRATPGRCPECGTAARDAACSTS